MAKNGKPRLVAAGPTLFVQACARMMGAAWIYRQMLEASTAPTSGISGIAYSMRFTIASDIGLSFELAIKSLAQGLSENPDGQPQVRESHELASDLWLDIREDVRDEIDSDAEGATCGTFGEGHSGKVLTFSEYLAKHSEFLNRTVGNRYGIGGKTQWKSDHRFILGSVLSGILGLVAPDNYEGRQCVDGMGVLMAYWWAIMRKALGLRWEDARCEVDDELAAQRDEAWSLVERAVEQMFGGIKIMTHEELPEKAGGKPEPGNRERRLTHRAALSERSSRG